MNTKSDASMRALTITRYGDMDTSLKLQSMPIPSIGEYDVLIKTHAAGLNPFDYKIARGDFKGSFKTAFPSVVGLDVSGEVVKIGTKVTRFKQGELVMTKVGQEYVGTVSEYAVTHEDHIALKPSSLTFEQAASLPSVGLTAWQVLTEVAQLSAGQSVLIHAGSGGVGSLAIQIAKQIGAKVTTTTSTANIHWVKALGADHVIDYKREDYRDHADEFDVVFDTLGGDYTADAFKVLKRGGYVVSVSGLPDDLLAQELGLNRLIRFILSIKARHITRAAKAKNAQYKMIITESNGAQLAHLGELTKSGQLKTVIDRTYTFDESITAMKYLEKGRAKGKVIISFQNQ